MPATPPLKIVYFSDVMCVWAYAAQIRLDELLAQFDHQVQIDYRFCAVYGDVEGRIQTHTGHEDNPHRAYAKKMQAVAAQFDHTRMHTDLFDTVTPASCNQAHLVLCAVRSAIARGQLEDPNDDLLSRLIRNVRLAFFEKGLNIGQMETLFQIVEQAEIPRLPIERSVNDGTAMAELSGDLAQVSAQKISGSPTYVLDGGREKLFGNVGYRIIEANVQELLLHRPRGASWC